MSRPAPYPNPLSLAEEALASDRGIIVNCNTKRIATNLRMNFYAKRQEARQNGETKYDIISCVLDEMNVLFLKEDWVQPKVAAL